MKNNYSIVIALVGALLAPAIIHAEPAAPNPRTDGAIDDSAITSQIKAKIAAEKFSATTNLTVDSDHAGVVKLKGVAASDAEAKRAVELAKGTQGVSAVKSEIIVKRTQ